MTVLADEPGIGKPMEEFVNGVKVIRWHTRSPGEAYQDIEENKHTV